MFSSLQTTVLRPDTNGCRGIAALIRTASGRATTSGLAFSPSLPPTPELFSLLLQTDGEERGHTAPGTEDLHQF